jgi:hypothetical protein
MPLPILGWVAVAATAAVVGAVLSSDSDEEKSKKDSEIYKRAKAKAKKEWELEVLKRTFENQRYTFEQKWNVNYNENYIEVPSKIQKLENESLELENKIFELNNLKNQYQI